MTSVLVDTSVWVGHFRRANPALQSLLAQDRVLGHPVVLLEIACGTPPAPRERTLGDLAMLRQAVVATAQEALALVGNQRLYESGFGAESGCAAVDVALLASVVLTPDALPWTADRNLEAQALRQCVTFAPARH